MAWVLKYVCASCQALISKDGGYCYCCGHPNPPAKDVEQKVTFPAQSTPFSTDLYTQQPVYTGRYQLPGSIPNEATAGYQTAVDQRGISAPIFQSQFATAQQAPMQQLEDSPTTYGSDSLVSHAQPSSAAITDTPSRVKKTIPPPSRGRSSYLGYKTRPALRRPRNDEERARVLDTLKAAKLEGVEEYQRNIAANNRGRSAGNSSGRKTDTTSASEDQESTLGTPKG